MTVRDQTGEVVVTTTATATTTTLAVTTGSQQSRGPSEGYSYPVCTTLDADTHESVVELLADKKPGASGRVFAITKDHATKTS
nr:hypothetical protein [Tanacetum cinerariifolium]